MLYVNKVMATVRITADLDPVTTTNSGWKIQKAKAVVCKAGKKDQAGNWVNDDNPCWIEIKAFQKASDQWGSVTTLDTASKGDILFVDGELALETWTDKQTGQKRSKHVVTANKIQFVSGGRVDVDFGAAVKGQQQPQSAGYGQQSRQYAPAGGGRQQSFGSPDDDTAPF